ncbi:hypothetical protein [Flavobacterium ammonificans]|uniref:hypothetical protein n=1 Tax=Flavobacterium ammonificans TaxID=1751056 RepID=UPI001E299195|nr:hypothetical protein [Flavobacterium ammonificans]BDB57139.1 hypothetical protein SHINM13_14350 [Flavobacterium ammonificans]
MASDHIKKPLKEWLNDFNDATSKISELVRNFAFAAIGIIWIFKSADLAKNIIPTDLIIPLKFVVIGLSLDLFQYIWKAINVYIFYSVYECRYDKGILNDNDISDVKFPIYIEIFSWLFFISKIIFIVLAYCNIYIFLISRIGS